MSQLRSYLLLSAVLMIFLLAGCSGPKSPELVSVEIADLSRTGGEGNLTVDLVYQNPNKKPVTVRTAPVAAKINQKELGTFELDSPFEIAAAASDTVSIQYAFTPDYIYPGFLSRQFGVVSSKRVQISLSGKIIFEKEGKKENAELEVPVDYSEVYKLPN